jgi:hypothetical protein
MNEYDRWKTTDTLYESLLDHRCRVCHASLFYCHCPWEHAEHDATSEAESMHVVDIDKIESED